MWTGELLLFKKKRYGLNLQAICDHDLLFRWIDLRYPGCASEYISWCTSELCKNLDKLWSQMISQGCTLIGDSAYVKKPYMAVPIKKGNLSSYEDGYNYYLSQLRVTIECDFGVLWNRWTLLRRPLCFHLKIIGSLVMCLCRLHNFCIKNRLRNRLTESMEFGLLASDNAYLNRQ